MKLLLILSLVLLFFAIKKLMPAVLRLSALKKYNAGENAKALKLYESAIKVSGGKKQYITEYSLLLMRLGNFSKATELLTGIIIDKKIGASEKINVRAYRALAYHKQGRDDDALEEMEELYKNTKSSVIYGLLGYLRQLSGNAEVEFCEEAYEYNSDDRDICDNLLVAYIRSGNYQKAEEIAKELREKFPKFTEAYYHSAVLAHKQGKSDEAKKYLQEIENCQRSMLTTISEEKIKSLKEEIENA